MNFDVLIKKKQKTCISFWGRQDCFGVHIFLDNSMIIFIYRLHIGRILTRDFRMSTYKSVADTIKEIEYWLRLSTFLLGPLKQSLLQILHNTGNDPSYDGLPQDQGQLYQELSNKHQKKLLKLKTKGILQQSQYDLIFPPNDNKTDSSKFDITLICILIRNCCTRLAKPLNGWDKYPPANDQSIAANVIRAREWRNYVHHTEPKLIDQQTFDTKWNEGTQIIDSLGYHNYDTNKLKQISLDPKHEIVLLGLFQYISLLTRNVNSLENRVIDLENGQTVFENRQTVFGNGQVEHSASITNLEDQQRRNTTSITSLEENQNDQSQAMTHLARQLGIIAEEVKNLSSPEQKANEHISVLSPGKLL